MSTQRPYRIMISGGGTGGHIYPAISIAQALEAQGAMELLFVGAQGKMEMRKVPEAGYKIVGLWISGLQRKLSLQNLLFPFKVISSLFKSYSLIRNFKPDAVIGVGGYASGPLLYAAASKKIPTLIQEQNSYAGLTNKWLSKRVNKICVAYEGMEKYFPKEKLIVTGNPVRNTIVLDPIRKEEAYAFFGFDAQKPVILMTGGSLGARTLNEAMLAGLEKYAAEGIQIIWQTGGFYFEEMKTRTTDKSMINVKMVDFLREMDFAYAIADVVIARAGALSIAELELTGKASILIPSPNVAEDHQTLNAKALEEREAAILLKDVDAVVQLEGVVRGLLTNAEQRKALEKNSKALAKPDAAKSIAEEIMKLVA
jgi:UDP-N-acetylglucosamine--N-acetylmuramyl-(pentapeptide) pyrophosphoryl-undecaprenol N-acetylglucosamine transferase